MMRANYYIAVILAFSGGTASLGQEPTVPGDTPAEKRLFGLLINQSKLAITVHLDRGVYFPGEEPEITIRVVNPTAQALEVPTPFDKRAGGVIFERSGIGPYNEPEWLPAQPTLEPFVITATPRDPEIPPTAWLPSNQPIERKFYPVEIGCGEPGAFARRCQVPGDPGEYRLRYVQSAATFHVVNPVIQSWAQVRLDKPYQLPLYDVQGKRTGNTVALPRWVRALVVKYGEQYFVAVSSAAGDTHVNFKSGDVFDSTLSHYFPTLRTVAASTAPITDLQITAGADENVQLTYHEHGGEPHRINLDSKRRVLVRE